MVQAHLGLKQVSPHFKRKRGVKEPASPSKRPRRGAVKQDEDEDD